MIWALCWCWFQLLLFSPSLTTLATLTSFLSHLPLKVFALGNPLCGVFSLHHTHSYLDTPARSFSKSHPWWSLPWSFPSKISNLSLLYLQHFTALFPGLFFLLSMYILTYLQVLFSLLYISQTRTGQGQEFLFTLFITVASVPGTQKSHANVYWMNEKLIWMSSCLWPDTRCPNQKRSINTCIQGQEHVNHFSGFYMTKQS